MRCHSRTYALGAAGRSRAAGAVVRGRLLASPPPKRGTIPASRRHIVRTADSTGRHLAPREAAPLASSTHARGQLRIPGRDFPTLRLRTFSKAAGWSSLRVRNDVAASAFHAMKRRPTSLRICPERLQGVHSHGPLAPGATGTSLRHGPERLRARSRASMGGQHSIHRSATACKQEMIGTDRAIGESSWDPTPVIYGCAGGERPTPFTRRSRESDNPISILSTWMGLIRRSRCAVSRC